MGTINEKVQAYRDLREELSVKRKEFNSFEESQKEQMLEIETEILKICAETGVDSLKTPNGTAFRTTKTYARLGAGAECKEARAEYAKRTGDFGLFTSHVNKSHAKELLEEGVNLTEIGIDWIEEFSIGFRKPT